MDKAQAFHSFWSGFGWKAYEQSTVPDNAPNQYITYEFAEGYIGDTLALSASLWTRSTSWTEIEQKAQEIGSAIGLNGKVLSYDGGKLWILRGATFAQRLEEPSDRDMRRIVINIMAEYISA